MKKRVVVTGMGVITPVGHNIESFWKSLKHGISGVDYIRSFSTSDFPCHIGAEVKNFKAEDHFSSKEKNRMDSFTQYALIAAREAIAQASLNLKELDPFSVGVIVGSGTGGTAMLLDSYQKMLSKGPRGVSPYLASGMLIDSTSGQIAIALGAKGKSGAFVTACATGSNCIGESMRAIQYGDSDIMIAGGTEGDILPIDLASFSKIKALSTNNKSPEEASRPFDKLRDGFVMGAGGGILVLESLESAKDRGVPILAEIIGYGATTDAHHVTTPDPTGQGAQMAMIKAIKDAEISRSDIDYINAHGTSTRLNDYTETMAIKNVFGTLAQKIPVSSIKSMTGHLLAGAGAVELISSILTIQNSIIPPTLNYEFQDEELDLDYVPQNAIKREVNVVLSNSFGFGGHNSCLIVKKWREGEDK